MVMVIWVIKVSIFFIENILEDKYLVQINLNILMISKLIYKTFYCRLIYIKPDWVLKATKDVEIFINKIETLKYHYKPYILSKSIYIISYTFLALIARCFIKIYIDIIEYKLLSTNNYKYIIHLLNRHFNYQCIFFVKTKEIIFEKFVEVLIFLKNQTSLKI